MARERKQYVCRECEHVEVRWMGRCSHCGAWNTFDEQGAGGAPLETGGRRSRLRPASDVAELISLPEVSADRMRRMKVRPDDLNRVLGGGLVPGSLVLIGGAPGVGKSTLLTALAGDFAKHRRRSVYLSGEESAAQVRGRAERIGALDENFYIVEEAGLERVLPTLYKNPPKILVVDSIQAVYSEELDGIPGSVSQIRFCGGLLADFARATDCAVVLVGHVTKEGDLAGPRVLEHLVDVVLYFEPDDRGTVRMIRAFKNRFGAIGELAVMEMTGQGLVPVRDASALFLAGRLVNEPGSAVTAIQTGTRPFLVEVQALLTSSNYATPTRVVSGVDSRRVALLAAILERKGKVQISGLDIFVKIAGGLKVDDPGADLALVAAMASSVRDLALPADQILLGEVGLTGELRPAEGLATRLNEAAAHGFRRAVVACFDRRKIPKVEGMRVEPVRTLAGALAASFGLGKIPSLQEES